jgi:hypothetical protein
MGFARLSGRQDDAHPYSQLAAVDHIGKFCQVPVVTLTRKKVASTP